MARRTEAPEARRAEIGWALYDWANSAFATTVMAGFFPLFFKRYWSPSADAGTSTLELGVANSAASLIVAIAAPLLGAVADAAGARKRFLAVFAALGVIATGSLWFIGRGQWLWASVLYVLGSIGFMAGNVFYDSLIVRVAKESRRDVVSALGYACGYLGGGLLFAGNVAMALRPEWFGLKDSTLAVRLAFIMVALWWAVFSIPLFLWVEEPRLQAGGPLTAIRSGVKQLGRTFRRVREMRAVAAFLIAYWLYIDAVDTVIRMAVDYGLSIGLDSSDLIVALLVTQFVGFPAALAFGWLGEKFGAKRGILAGIVVYIGITLWASRIEDARDFHLLAVGVGLVQGGVQALSRSLYASLIPAGQSAEFFGFYNMLGKFAAVLGPFLVGVTSSVSGSPRVSLLVIVVLFIAGGGLLQRLDVAAAVRARERFEETLRGQ